MKGVDWRCGQSSQSVEFYYTPRGAGRRSVYATFEFDGRVQVSLYGSATMDASPHNAIITTARRQDRWVVGAEGVMPITTRIERCAGQNNA
jgi:hypothetical protein